MSIVTGKYSSEFVQTVNGTITGTESVFTVSTADGDNHDVDAKTFASTNLGDDIEVTTVVTVTNKTVSQVAALGTTVG